jgi:inosine-uridine nucleoside N-ribohydrolase
VIIDCDPGGDDAQAMVLAFHMAKKMGIEIVGVTTVAGNAVLE